MDPSAPPSGSEVVFAFVGAIGTPTTRYVQKAIQRLGAFGYEGVPIRLSDLLPQLQIQGLLRTQLVQKPEYERIVSYMDAGDELRNLGMPGARGLLATAALAEIASRRNKSGAPARIMPLPRTAWLLNSLKNPAEVQVLRNTYGAGFFLIGLFSPESERLQDLRDRGLNREQAKRLVDRDTGGGPDHGQQTRKTFELADAWISCDDDLVRFLDLVFGDVFKTPTLDENAMAFAYTAALRSSDLSRQVGAAIVATKGDVIATGCNEAPAPGGGQYFPPTEEQPAARDVELGEDSNAKERLKIQVQISSDVAAAIEPMVAAIEQHLGSDANPQAIAALENMRRSFAGSVEQCLDKSRLRDITEYGRAVHAEMSALMSAARLGIPVQGATLYCTTFPCHNCAKHIVAAGIKRVVFVEPYPKSKAKDLHSDAIELVGEESKPTRLSELTKDVAGSRTQFAPFIGVGPRRYFDLFSLCLGTGRTIQRKDQNGDVLTFQAEGTWPRVPMPATDYLDEELEAINLLDTVVQQREGLGSHE